MYILNLIILILVIFAILFSAVLLYAIIRIGTREDFDKFMEEDNEQKK